MHTPNNQILNSFMEIDSFMYSQDGSELNYINLSDRKLFRFFISAISVERSRWMWQQNKWICEIFQFYNNNEATLL